MNVAVEREMPVVALVEQTSERSVSSLFEQASAPMRAAEIKAKYVADNPASETEPVAAQEASTVRPARLIERISDLGRFYCGSGGLAQDWTHLLGDRVGIAGGVATGVATVAGLGIGVAPIAAGVAAGVGVYAAASLASDRLQQALWGKSYYQAV